LNVLSGIARIIDALNEWIGRATAWIVFITVLLSAFGALVRYADKYIGTSLSRNEYNEGQWYLYAIAFMFMGAYTLKNSGHVRVDILATRLPKKVQLWIEAILSLLFVAFVYGVVFVLSWDFVARSWQIWESSPDANGLPRWIIKPFLSIGMLLMSLQGLAEFCKAIVKLFDRSNNADEGSDALKGAV
jgi:TRAP-type mannitol/chloroaromatic compound transport system permease small subunit